MYILLIILFLLFLSQKEGFVTIYNNNELPYDKPDDTQYMACMDSNEDYQKGNNNYKTRMNSIEEPLEGTYSNFIEVYKIRKEDNLFNSPICEDKYSFITDITNASERKIIMQEDEDRFLELREEIKLDELGLKDPMYLHGSPNMKNNKIIYDDKLLGIFLKNREPPRVYINP